MRDNPALKHGAVLLGLAVLIALAYSNSFKSGFVLDNDFIVKKDPRLRAATAENLKLVFTQDYWYPLTVGGLYRPITTLSFLFDYSILKRGENAAGYHWINLALHLLNATLVYFLMLRLTARMAPAALAAAIFAVHPVAVESVTNLVGRADLLAAATVLGATLAYIRSTESTDWRRSAWLFGVMLLAAIGVLCKESAIVVVAILPAFDLVYRLRENDSWRARRRMVREEFFLRGWVVLVPVVVGMFLVRRAMYYHVGVAVKAFADNPMRATNFFNARMTAIKVIGHYFRLLLWPVKLSCDYSFNQIPVFTWRIGDLEFWRAIAALIVIVMILAAAWRVRRTQRAVLFLALFFFIALAPTSNLIILIDSVMAERFLYLPLVGFAGCIAIAADAIGRRFEVRWPAAALAPLIALLAIRTHYRNADWHDNVSLWRSAVKVVPNSYRAQRQLAWALYMRNQPPTNMDEVVAHCERAVAVLRDLSPENDDMMTHLYLGMFYGINAEALPRADPAHPDVLGAQQRELYEKSIAELERARRVDRVNNAQHREHELKRGRRPETIVDVGQTQIYQNLAVSYSRLGRHDAAADAYRMSRAINPSDAAMYNRIAEQLAQAGKLEEAAITLLEAALIGHGDDFTMNQLAQVYRAIDAGPSPAIVMVDGKPHYNMNSLLVLHHLCAACHELAQLFDAVHNDAMVKQVRDLAKQKLHCDDLR